MQQGNSQESKQLLINKMKPLVKEEHWAKFLKSVEDDLFPDFYFENYAFNISLMSMANDYRTLAVREKKAYPYLQASERNETIRQMRYNETEVIRLRNRKQTHWKEKISKLKRIDWLSDDVPKEEMIQKFEKWTTEIKKTLRGSGICKN
jgi:hypothetical protein